jgi:hypothetical protein
VSVQNVANMLQIARPSPFIYTNKNIFNFGFLLILKALLAF